MSNKRFLECAKIINTHGIKGDVKLESFCDSPDILCDLEKVYFKEGESFRPAKVLRASIFKNIVIASIEGIDDIDKAIPLKGTVIYADREDFELDEGSYFIVDLIGLDVIDIESGEKYGKVADVINRGASDIYVVNTPQGERMIPAVEEFIKKIDLDSGVYIKTIPGLIKD